MQNVMIVGAGKGGTELLKILHETEIFTVVAVIDVSDEAPGIMLARQLGIPVFSDWRPHLTSEIDIVVEVTGKEEVFNQIREKRSKATVVIPGSVAFIITKLINEKKDLIQQLLHESDLRDLIFNSTNDGMIVIDVESKIVLYNKNAEKMVGVKKEDALGVHIQKVIPDSGLPRVLTSKEIEVNREQVLKNGVKIITTRIPMIDSQGKLYGAFAVFKNITEVVHLAEEITNLKEVQTMLEAIILSSDEAISVVDEQGKGILINPAYTRLTGLSKEQVIGQPATADISEGESMHLKVLQTPKPIRGTRMKVGPGKKEVVVNVAPIIVDGKLKGSVGVIHDMSEIQSLTNELNKAKQIIRSLEAKYTFDDIIGLSEEMQIAIEQARLAARTPITILLRGESGTGKELFAHAIHNDSNRKYNKFVRVNCAAISESLLESELFGYEEGAFSGAKRGGKKGLFEEAHNGSIFLDEIGELSLNTQAKLLRVLQENEIIRVGGTKPIPINVRVIAATNLNLEKGMAEGRFREDLYYRLNRMPIHIPPLHQRKQDIPLLCKRLLQKINQEYGRNIEKVSEAALEKLMDYNWPGNVRELENVLGRAVIFMKFHEKVLKAAHIPALGSKEADVINPGLNELLGHENKNLTDLLDQYEKMVIIERLEKCNGNKTACAKLLGISIRSLYYKIEKWELE
ncbi:PAS domain S-box-containing protein [Bacillus oleivorans]|uniref:PAS domain S-box-containing protein n=1 Tax=Bacillus oleivorans TaxID=1448271 RepID=A0A285CLT9_9BACI|nr:sigma 54-interacting transcriptional regulator [Bacillus oleivorans]SNX67986.1 PAS domain S-box-containing protein [Bacillus oleivorans]